MDNPSTHPNPHPSLHHRKIDLQSAADLTHLQTLLAQSAREKLDRHLPPQAIPATHISLGGQPSTEDDRRESDQHHTEDDLRRAVRLLIDDFLTQTWSAAAQNVAVNGIDATSTHSVLPLPNCTNPTPETLEETAAGTGAEEVQEREGVDFTYAAFDPRLQRRVAALHGELEMLTAQVSRLRREAPGTAAGGYGAGLREAMERDEEAWRAVLEAENQVQELELAGPKQGWEDVGEMYERGVGELAVLSGVEAGTGLTETVGRSQRAGRVAMELE